jgi:hypothetical protein
LARSLFMAEGAVFTGTQETPWREKNADSEGHQVFLLENEDKREGLEKTCPVPSFSPNPKPSRSDRARQRNRATPALWARAQETRGRARPRALTGLWTRKRGRPAREPAPFLPLADNSETAALGRSVGGQGTPVIEKCWEAEGFDILLTWPRFAAALFFPDALLPVQSKEKGKTPALSSYYALGLLHVSLQSSEHSAYLAYLTQEKTEAHRRRFTQRTQIISEEAGTQSVSSRASDCSRTCWGWALDLEEGEMLLSSWSLHRNLEQSPWSLVQKL